MRALQYFPTIEDPNTRRSLFEVCLLRSYLAFHPLCLSICIVYLSIFCRRSFRFWLILEFLFSGVTTDIDGD